MSTGKVVTAFPQRSFSFIQDDSIGQELVGHVSDYIDRTILPIGSPVQFEIGGFKGRSKAIRIRPVAAPETGSAR